MNKSADVYHLGNGYCEVQGHQATIDDIGTIWDAIRAFKNVRLCPMSDVIYISEIFNTMVMINSFTSATGCDSKLGQQYKKP